MRRSGRSRSVVLISVAIVAAAAFGPVAAARAAVDVPVPRMAPVNATLAVNLTEPSPARDAAMPLSVAGAIEREVAADVLLSVAAFYEARHFAPVWTQERAAVLRKRLAEAACDGLDPSDYAVAPAGPGVAGRAAEDVALTRLRCATLGTPTPAAFARPTSRASSRWSLPSCRSGRS